MKTRLLLVLFTLCFSSTFAQKKLADKFYKNFGYVKAAELYELAVKKGDSSMHVLTRLGDSYYNNGKTEKSAKWYESAVNKYEDKLESEYIFKYVQSLVSTKRYDDATQWAEKLMAMQNNDPSMKRYIEEGFDIYKISPEVDERLIVKLNNLDFNSKFSDFGAYVNGDAMYFASARDASSDLYDWNKEPFLDIYKVGINRNGETLSFDSTQKVKGGKVNTEFHEASVAVSNDGKTLYFTRDNLTRRNRLDYTRDGTTNLQIFKVTLDEESNKWTNLEQLPFNDEAFSSGHPALSPDNKKLYFASDREGGLGDSDLYEVDINEDGTYSEPRNLGPNVNTPGRELFPYVSKDNTLYYSSDGLLNYGLLDIYKSDVLNNAEAESENLGEPYNSGSDDFAYIIDSETKEGYLSSNREGGKGSDDIYGFNAYLCEQVIEGTVTDKRTSEPLADANVRLLDSDGKLLKEATSDQDGNYKFEGIICQRTYTVVGTKDDYKQDQKIIATNDVNDISNKADLSLEPLIIDNQIVINPIFFDFDKSNIRTDAQYELENIVDVLRKHPTMVIKIESHTDSRGRDKYNMKLSDRRAKSTRDYLLSRDIEASRIESAIGFGESQLLNKCSNGVKCSKDEHQLNRRSYFYILKN